jgi:hypothetical protein
LYEGNVSLSSKYLGINDKAVNANLIDGINSTQLARTDVNATFNQGVTVSGAINANGGIYENGQALSSKYLGISGTAANSSLLDGIDSSSFFGQGYTVL